MDDPERPPDSLPHDQRRSRRPQSERPLRRSRQRILGGVAAGIADFVRTEPSWVRWIFALSVPLTFGFSALVYGILWVLLPPAEREPPGASD